jgi:hypothetical protein
MAHALKAPQVGFALDEARVAADARFDGIFVLRTNTTLDPLQAMLRYRELQGVEKLCSAAPVPARHPAHLPQSATPRSAVGRIMSSTVAYYIKRKTIVGGWIKKTHKTQIAP